MKKIKFIYKQPKGDRVHYVNEADVRVVLNRLPEELWAGLSEVYFNDYAFQGKKNSRLYLGYVGRDRKKFTLSICALPPRVSLSSFCQRKVSPRMFGAQRGRQWPTLAVRRFLLYDVLLQEIGHHQIIDPKAKTDRRKFAGETKSQEFADAWRKTLWLDYFDHPDPVHNPPTREELEALEGEE